MGYISDSSGMHDCAKENICLGDSEYVNYDNEITTESLFVVCVIYAKFF